MTSIKIDLLKNHPHAIPLLANLWHTSLGQLWEPETSYEEIEKWFYDWLNEVIPLALVALDNNKPVGMCSVQFTDGIRPELKPWLGDLCVDPAHRKQGIGKLLIEEAKHRARLEGFNTLYLLAPDATIPAYYVRLGWHHFDIDEYKGHSVTLMETPL
jgi:GNAT superfamily N-acetyltransferase